MSVINFLSAAAAKTAAKASAKVPACVEKTCTFKEFIKTYQDDLIYCGTRVLLGLVVVVCAWIAYKIIAGALNRFSNRTRWCDDATTGVLKRVFKWGIVFLAFLIILDLCGVNTASLLTVLGAVGLAVGLALKDTLSNMAAGIVLLVMRPYNPGDYIECGSVAGTIQTMGLLTSVVTTPDGLFVSVPNTALQGAPIKNFNRNDLRRVDIVVGVSYSDNIEEGVKALMKFMEENAIILKEPVPKVLIAELADSSVNLQLRFWVKSSQYWDGFWSVKNELKNTLEGAGLHIPFPQRVVTFTNAPREIQK